MVNNPPESLSRSRDRESVLLFNQIEQKRKILEELGLYSAKNFILISHSIGALMMLHLIKPSVTLAIGLTPTVERMKASKQGQHMAPKFDHWLFLPFIQFLFFLMSIMPESLRRALIKVRIIHNSKNCDTVNATLAHKTVFRFHRKPTQEWLQQEWLIFLIVILAKPRRKFTQRANLRSVKLKWCNCSVC